MTKFLTCHMPMLGLLATGSSFMSGSSLQTVAVLLSIKYVSGHGYTTDPPTRAYACKNQEYKDSKGCRDHVGPAIYEPHSNGNGDVNGKPQDVVKTNICGAGVTRFAGLAHYPAADWKATPITPVGGKFHFKYHCTACHKTLSWEAWVTKPGWTGESGELKWSDMKRFCKIKKNGEKPPADSEYDCPFPEATGNARDIILILWDRIRQDSGEMFFSCSDVIIGGGGGATTTATTTTANKKEAQVCKSQGQRFCNQPWYKEQCPETCKETDEPSTPTTSAPVTQAPTTSEPVTQSPSHQEPNKNVSKILDKIIEFIETLRR